MQEEENRIIYAFPRGKGEEVQIAIRRLNDKYYIDLRQWYQAKNEATFLPTKKGIRLPAHALAELQRGVDRLSKAIAGLEEDQK